MAAAPLVLGVIYIALGGAGLVRSNASPAMLGASVLLGAVLLWLSVIDMRTMRLPDAITLPLTAAGPLVTWTFGWGDPLWHLTSAVAGYLLLFGFGRAYAALRGRAGLGLGDAKLFAAAGGWLGLEALPFRAALGDKRGAAAGLHRRPAAAAAVRIFAYPVRPVPGAGLLAGVAVRSAGLR
jgi:leader peptidase (prepilin peptidase)/N-methyltransferase